MRRLLTALVFISMTAPVYAAWKSGAELLEQCEADNKINCSNYIAGAMDAIYVGPSKEVRARAPFLDQEINSGTHDTNLEKLFLARSRYSRELREIREPNRFERAGIQRKVTPSCIASEFGNLSPSDVPEYLIARSVPDCLYNILWTLDDDTVGSFGDVYLQAVFAAIESLASEYDGTNDQGLYQLWFYAHVSYYHAFYSETVSLDAPETLAANIAASRAFAASSYLLDDNPEAGTINSEWLLCVDQPGVRQLFLEEVKEVIAAFNAERALVDEHGWAFTSALVVLFRGMVNSDMDFQAVLEADDEIVSLLETLATASYLTGEEEAYAVDATRELSRLLSLDGLRDPVILALRRVLDVYERLSQFHLVIAPSLESYVDCTEYDVCTESLKVEVETLAFPNRFVFDDGLLVMETPLDEGVARVLYHAAKEVRGQFHRLIQHTDKVAGDTNDTLTMKIHGSITSYKNYQDFLYGLPTNNGGIYIESWGTFYTYQRTPNESIYTLEELFRHEYMHYLASRFLIHGNFGDAIYDDCRLTWFDEGLAEYLAGSTRGNGIAPRAIIVSGVQSDGDSRMSLNETISSCYTGGFKFYRYAGLLFDFLAEEHPGTLSALFDALRANDIGVFDETLATFAASASSEADYQQHIDSRIATLDELDDPSTSFPLPRTLDEAQSEAIQTGFRNTAADSDVDCAVRYTGLDRRFGCTGEMRGTVLSAPERVTASTSFSESLDGWLRDAVSYADNFEAMVCHFGEISFAETAEGQVPKTPYDCEGPLRSLNFSVDADGDGTADSVDDFPTDWRSAIDDNGNGVLDDTEITDSDSDGMPDGYEIAYGLDPQDSSDASVDHDSDLVSSIDEFRGKTDPFDSNDTPPSVDLNITLRLDSEQPSIYTRESLYVYLNLRFGQDLPSIENLRLTITTTARVQLVELRYDNDEACTVSETTSLSAVVPCTTPSDGTLDFWLYFTPLEAGSLELTATWESDLLDPDLSNNSATLIVLVPAANTTDVDNDGVLDADDAFPLESVESVDTDSDGIGNNSDSDDDGDAVLDALDRFPLDASETLDTDNDGLGNNIDTDDDGDGMADIHDVFPLDQNEQVDSDSDGVGDNADVFPGDAKETLDTDGDAIGNNADDDDDGDGVSDTQEAVDGTDPLDRYDCSGCFDFDIDIDGGTAALTDGLLVLRHLFGFEGTTLTSGVVTETATRSDANTITSYLDTNEGHVDIDGNGTIEALTDGLLLLRYLFGFDGATLIEGAVSTDATRTTANEIKTYIQARIATGS